VLNPDEEVLLPSSSNKLLAQWQRPYRILHRLGKVNYEVYMLDKRKRRSVFHVNMLKKWCPPEATCFWIFEDTESEGDDIVPSCRGE